MTDDQQRALVEQRHREALAVEMAGLRIRMAELAVKEVQLNSELAALRADAERARWCEESEADVTRFKQTGLWYVSFYSRDTGTRCTCHPDRNAAIDLARGAA